MGESALKDNECGGLAKAVRIPSLPGRQPGAPQVDTDCDAYKAGYAAATSALQASATEQEARHESFVASIGEMYAEMEMRYRQETLSLVERLFGAVAPALAVKSSLADIKAIVEERAQRNHSELSLRVHPSLIAHLGEADQRILNETPLVTLKSDESCAPATVDAQWKKGGLYHDPDALIENVLAALRDEAGSAEGDES